MIPMSIRSLIPASAICGAMLVPAFASLSNLDRKYNTGGARQTTTTTNRKPAVSRTAGRTPKPQREAGQAATTVKPDRGQAQEKPRKGNSEPETINPAEDEDLAANLKLVTDMLTAWKNGDDQTLLDIFTPIVIKTSLIIENHRIRAIGESQYTGMRADHYGKLLPEADYEALAKDAD